MSEQVEFVLAYAGCSGFRNTFSSDEEGHLHKIALVVIKARFKWLNGTTN
jgi:hypothetical protein